MSPRARRSLRASRIGLAALALGVLPATAPAQVPGDGEGPRTRLRDRYKGPQGTQRLDESIRKLNGDDPEARLEGIKGLGEVNDPKAIQYLMGAASDPDMRIRVKAIDTLGLIKAKEATPLLIQQLTMRDTDLGTKQRILACLGKIGDRRATGPLVDFLSRNVDSTIRANAIFALGDIADPAALPALQTLASDGDPALRAVAGEAVRKIREKPAPPVVPSAMAGDRRRGGGAGADAEGDETP